MLFGLFPFSISWPVNDQRFGAPIHILTVDPRKWAGRGGKQRYPAVTAHAAPDKAATSQTTPEESQLNSALATTSRKKGSQRPPARSDRWYLLPVFTPPRMSLLQQQQKTTHKRKGGSHLFNAVCRRQCGERSVVLCRNADHWDKCPFGSWPM